MGIYDKAIMQSVARRSMTIYFLIDTTTSMQGNKINTVNQALSETLPLIREISASNADASIKIAILTVSSCVEWITPPVPVENFKLPTITAKGHDNLCTAYNKLNEMLKSESDKNHGAGCYAPVFIYMADGGKGQGSYKYWLNTIWSNTWFAHGIKAAIAIGNEAHLDILYDFTRCEDTVIRVHNKDKLRKIIQFVTVQSSQIASKSSNVSIPNHNQTHKQTTHTRSNSPATKPNATGQNSPESECLTLKALDELAAQKTSHFKDTIDTIQSKQDEMANSFKSFEAAEDDGQDYDDW